MNEDWRVGDLAVCITDGWECDYPGPALGSVHRVIEITDDVLTTSPERHYLLRFAEWPKGRFACTDFRKVRPDAEPAEAEFTALIKRPVRKRVRATAHDLINPDGGGAAFRHDGGSE